MEKNEQSSSSAPRRRRRRRGSGKGSAQAAAQQAQREPREATEKNTAKEGKKAPRSAAPNQEDGRSRHRGQSKKPEGQGSARSGNAPAREPRQPHAPAPRRTARGRHAADDDPGLVLITRRPPKQKFANFEEYLAAHGGMTAPLPEEEGSGAVPAVPVAGGDA